VFAIFFYVGVFYLSFLASYWYLESSGQTLSHFVAASMAYWLGWISKDLD
jgi:hypothetical protein